MAKKTSIINMSLASALPTFSGEHDENISFFIDQMSQMADLEEWNEQRKSLVLKIQLRGKALKFVMENESCKNMSFGELTKLLEKKFTRSESFEIIQNNFTSIRQAQNQSVEELADKVAVCAAKYFGCPPNSNEEVKKLTQKAMLSKFIEALRPDLRLEVKKLGPMDFVTAVNQAKNIEKALEDSGTSSNAPDYSQEINTLIMQQMQNNKAIEELSGKIEELVPVGKVNNLNEVEDNTNQNVNDGNVSCHICQENHWTTECPDFPLNSSYRPYRPARANYRNNFYRGNFINKRSRYINRYAPTRGNRFINNNRYNNRRYNIRRNTLNE